MWQVFTRILPTGLLRSGATQREIERQTGISRHTIRTYRKKFDSQAQAMVLRSDCGEPGQTAPPWPPTPLALPAPPSSTAISACETHRALIEAQLQLRRNAMAVYQDLVDRHGFAGAYNSVKRFVAKLRQREPEQFDRLSFLPGD